MWEVSSYYKFLTSIFPGAEILLMNINPKDVQGVRDSIIGSAVKMPFKDATFDVITSFDLIEHLINPDDFLSESFRILKRWGWLVISTPNLADFYSRITFLFGYTPFSYDPSSKFKVAVPFSKVRDIDRGYKSVFTFKALGELLMIHGFKIIQKEGYCYCDDFYISFDSRRQKREIGF